MQADPLASKTKRGAAGELIVCADLAAKGYDVFRAVNPDSKHDLVICKHDRCFTVQVKSVWAPKYDPDKTLQYIIKKARCTCDILAVVVDGDIHYHSESIKL